MGFIVAIDGPAGTGKSTVTKILAKRLKLLKVDTGAMYRCVAFACLKENIKIEEEDKIKKILENFDMKFPKTNKGSRVILNGSDVTEKIRTPKVDNVVAEYAALKCVRDKLTPIQQKMGRENDVIMEGREIRNSSIPKC